MTRQLTSTYPWTSLDVPFYHYRCRCKWRLINKGIWLEHLLRNPIAKGVRCNCMFPNTYIRTCILRTCIELRCQLSHCLAPTLHAPSETIFEVLFLINHGCPTPWRLSMVSPTLSTLHTHKQRKIVNYLPVVQFRRYSFPVFRPLQSTIYEICLYLQSFPSLTKSKYKNDS